MKVREMLRVLHEDGWQEVSRRGSHRQLKHELKKGRVTVPGCVATGDTIEETELSIRDAIVFHLDGLRADDLPIPDASSRVDYVEVAA